MIGTTTTDPVQDIIAAGVLLTSIVGLMNRRTQVAVEKKTDTQTDKIDDAASKLNDVHELVNSPLNRFGRVSRRSRIAHQRARRRSQGED
jgi:hypothetical protein